MVCWSRCFGCAGSKWGGRKSLGKLVGSSRYSLGSMEETEISDSESGVDMVESLRDDSCNGVLVDVSE